MQPWIHKLWKGMSFGNRFAQDCIWSIMGSLRKLQLVTVKLNLIVNVLHKMIFTIHS